MTENNTSGQSINEDIFVTEVTMNRKVARFVSHAIEHYWEGHYTDDELVWEDLDYIFEHLKEYGSSKVELPPCGHIICVNPDEDADCDDCKYNTSDGTKTDNVKSSQIGIDIQDG